MVQLYELDDKYKCPEYCEVDHIHIINDYEFDKNNKIKIYIQK